jgi:hypothetical protein
MADIALWTTMISATGAGASALAALAITNRGTLKRDRQLQDQKEAEQRRIERAAHETERRESWKRLVGGASRVKAGIRLLGEGYQADLEERTRALREAAIATAEEAAIVGGLFANEPGAAQVAAAAQQLADATADVVTQLDHAIRRLPGAISEVVGEVCFADFDSRMAELQRALGRASTEPAISPPAVSSNGRSAVRQGSRSWFARRDASSRF